MQRKIVREQTFDNDFVIDRATPYEEPEQKIGIDPGRINMFSAYMHETDTHDELRLSVKGSQLRDMICDWDRRQKRYWVSKKIDQICALLAVHSAIRTSWEPVN